MAKEVDKVLKLQIRGGAANPSPPVGPALGAAVLTLWISVTIQLKKSRQTW